MIDKKHVVTFNLNDTDIVVSHVSEKVEGGEYIYAVNDSSIDDGVMLIDDGDNLLSIAIYGDILRYISNSNIHLGIGEKIIFLLEEQDS